MQEFQFYKYQGTGNDFVIIDNRQSVFPKNDTKRIEFLCHRKFGIGADGLILVENDNSADFSMLYFNSDGSQSSMCGNGGRCVVAFAKKMGIIQYKTTFKAIDGLHDAVVHADGSVSLEMIDVDNVEFYENGDLFLNTGSPHHISFVHQVNEVDVFTNGRKIRRSVLYGSEGSNVNFVQIESPNSICVRTYERGVEDETLSCGTGVTAAVLAGYASNKLASSEVDVKTPGGALTVSFQPRGGAFTKVKLTGPATFVFQGSIMI